MVFRLLSCLWGYGVSLHQHSFNAGWRSQTSVTVPVISVGGLEVGGSGKTPIVAFLIHNLLQKGYKPGLLSRGYGRLSRGLQVWLPQQQQQQLPPSPQQVGDEPAMLSRAYPQLYLGISAQRLQAAQVLIAYGVNILLLDDGFNHRQLQRNIDIVVLRPELDMRTAKLLPAGRLREPLAALNRADVLWLHSKTTTAVMPPVWVSGFNQPQIYSHSCFAVVNLDQQPKLPQERLLAVCGIAVPDSFFAALQQIKLAVAQQCRYPDHHRYCQADIRRLQQLMITCGATALITTAKDAIKLQYLWPQPEKLFILQSQVCIDNPTIFNAVFNKTQLSRPLGR